MPPPIIRRRHAHVFGVGLADACGVLCGPMLEVVEKPPNLVYGAVEARDEMVTG